MCGSFPVEHGSRIRTRPVDQDYTAHATGRLLLGLNAPNSRVGGPEQWSHGYDLSSVEAHGDISAPAASALAASLSATGPLRVLSHGSRTPVIVPLLALHGCLRPTVKASHAAAHCLLGLNVPVRRWAAWAVVAWICTTLCALLKWLLTSPGVKLCCQLQRQRHALTGRFCSQSMLALAVCSAQTPSSCGAPL